MYVHVLPVESSSWQTDFLQERSLDLHTTKQNKHHNTDLPFISVFIDPPSVLQYPALPRAVGLSLSDRLQSLVQSPTRVLQNKHA